MLKRFLNNEEGAISTFFVILLPLILICMSVAFDGARIFVCKHELQSVADASSLAGASATVGKLTFDEFGNIAGERPVLDETLAYTYAEQVLNDNINIHNFPGQGITVMSKDIKTDIDADGDGVLDSCNVKITAEIESLLYGPLTGNGDKITVIRESQAKIRDET